MTKAAMPLRVQNQNSKTRKGLKQKEKEKANSTRDEKKGVTWASTTRCTLSDLCAPDKKKISNLISKVVELNSANEKLEAELATFRKESEKLRNENMELHKLNGSLQTRLMQSLVLTKTYQDQIKHEKRVFSMGATDAGKSSAPTKTTLNPIIDFSNRRERDSDKVKDDGVRPKTAEDDSKPTSAPTVSKLDKTTLEDRTLYFDSALAKFIRSTALVHLKLKLKRTRRRRRRRVLRILDLHRGRNRPHPRRT